MNFVRFNYFTLILSLFDHSYCTSSKENHSTPKKKFRKNRTPLGVLNTNEQSNNTRQNPLSSFSINMVYNKMVSLQVNLNDRDLKYLNVSFENVSHTTQQDSFFKALAYFIIRYQIETNPNFKANFDKIREILCETISVEILLKYRKLLSEEEERRGDEYIKNKKKYLLEDTVDSYIDLIRLYHGLTPENISRDEVIVCNIDLFVEDRVTPEEKIKNKFEKDGLLSEELEVLFEGCMKEIREFFSSDHVILEGNTSLEEDMEKIYDKTNQVLRSFYIYDFISIEGYKVDENRAE